MRVIFGVAPVWAYWVPVVSGIVVGLTHLAMGIFFARIYWHLIKRFPPGYADALKTIRGSAVEIFIYISLGALFWWGGAAHSWWIYRRWGRVPRVLTASDEGLTFSRLRWWGIRERKWPASEIRAIELRPVRWNLTWKRTVADLWVHRRKGVHIRFRLSASDAKLPRLIAERIRSKLAGDTILIIRGDGHLTITHVS